MRCRTTRVTAMATGGGEPKCFRRRPAKSDTPKPHPTGSGPAAQQQLERTPPLVHSILPLCSLSIQNPLSRTSALVATATLAAKSRGDSVRDTVTLRHTVPPWLRACSRWRASKASRDHALPQRLSSRHCGPSSRHPGCPCMRAGALSSPHTDRCNLVVCSCLWNQARLQYDAAAEASCARPVLRQLLACLGSHAAHPLIGQIFPPAGFLDKAPNSTVSRRTSVLAELSGGRPCTTSGLALASGSFCAEETRDRHATPPPPFSPFGRRRPRPRRAQERGPCAGGGPRRGSSQGTAGEPPWSG